ncbi:MAG: ATP-binding protein [Candidatus Bathyarchaeota archaeon]|nr:MAG: ATP-binding protein [Candidatus Bathyarchaeota archaeon]
MSEIEVVGQVVGGKAARILVREKSGKKIELGDLLAVEEKEALLILQVYDLGYGSQVSQSTRELLAGLKLEGYGAGLTFLEPQLRNYVMAEVKAVARIEGQNVRIPKTLPSFFSSIRHITKADLAFLTKPSYPIYLGKVRSGSETLDVPIHLNGMDILRHHVVVPATTGRGKSNLVKVMLWSILGQDRFGILVLDPHDEYYGRHGKGLKDHPKAKDNLLYYSSNPPAGTNTLIVNIKSIDPRHFEGIVAFTDAQQDAIKRYRNLFGEEWIENIVRGKEVQGVAPRTLGVLQRKFDNILGIHLDDSGEFQSRNKVFSDTAGITTTTDIANKLEDGKIIVVDTSRLIDEAELLIGSIVVGSIFHRYQRFKSEGKLEEKPVVSVVIEEAPRVLGKEVLATSGGNIYSTVAREGRKFKVGLIAITQLTSLIPRSILANMNTKIILGNEMALERHAIIDSAAQDLSDDDRTIASLDTGEAIVSSNFTKFAVPIQVPKFEDYAEVEPGKKEMNKTVFVG